VCEQSARWLKGKLAAGLATVKTLCTSMPSEETVCAEVLPARLRTAVVVEA